MSSDSNCWFSSTFSSCWNCISHAKILKLIVRTKIPAIWALNAPLSSAPQLFLLLCSFTPITARSDTLQRRHLWTCSLISNTHTCRDKFNFSPSACELVMGSTRQEVAKALKVDDELIVEKVSFYCPKTKSWWWWSAETVGAFWLNRILWMH